MTDVENLNDAYDENDGEQAVTIRPIRDDLFRRAARDGAIEGSRLA